MSPRSRLAPAYRATDNDGDWLDWTEIIDPDGIFDPTNQKVTADGVYAFHLNAFPQTVDFEQVWGTNPVVGALLWPQTGAYVQTTAPTHSRTDEAPGVEVSVSGPQKAADRLIVDIFNFDSISQTFRVQLMIVKLSPTPSGLGALSWATLLRTGLELPSGGDTPQNAAWGGGSDGSFVTNDPDTFAVEDGNIGIAALTPGMYLAFGSIGVAPTADLNCWLTNTGTLYGEDISMQTRWGDGHGAVIPMFSLGGGQTSQLGPAFLLVGSPGNFEIWGVSDAGYEGGDTDWSLTVIKIGDIGNATPLTPTGYD